jgi:hypothetical protein
MGFYDIDYNDLVFNLTPQTRRKPRFISWFLSLLAPQKNVSDFFFDVYVGGQTYPYYDPLTPIYAIGTRVTYLGGVYEATTNVVGTRVPTDRRYWKIILNDFRGVNERVRLNSQKILLEFTLNKWFNTTWLQPNDPFNPTRPEIYVDSNLTDNQVLTSYYTENAESNVYYYDSLTYAYVLNSYTFNQPAFSIFVPIAFYTGLGLDAELQIRAIADKYVIAGITYDIQTY